MAALSAVQSANPKPDVRHQAVEAIVAEADLHCHILPAWDDGPRALDESLRMAARAAAAGLKKILVTPHVGRKFGSTPERAACGISAATAELEHEIKAQDIDIELVPGAELTLGSRDLVERVAVEPWLTIGGQGLYVLIESPYRVWPEYADQIVYQLALRGVTTIIVHPERYVNVQQKPTMLERSVERGALLQVTARSLVGKEERAARQCSYRLMEAGLVSLIASDAHTSRGILPNDVVQEVKSAVGEAAARTIMADIPRLVLAGEPAPPPPVPRPETSRMTRGRFWPFANR